MNVLYYSIVAIDQEQKRSLINGLNKWSLFRGLLIIFTKYYLEPTV